ncbi:MAG: PcfJ domain-containing protein [Raineya sp.]|jgi:hypothetical protein|nr:PcfJ domain-containing protein [Raineya sp.]
MGNQKKVPLYMQLEAIEQTKIQKQQQYQEILKTPKDLSKVFSKNIELIFAKKSYQYVYPEIFNKIKADFEQLKEWKYSNHLWAYKALLQVLAKKRCFDLLQNYEYLASLKKIALKSNYFIREIETWERKSHNVTKQWTDLLKHLFVEYPVPAFLNSAWLTDKDNYMQWYIDLAQGKSVRKLSGLPFTMTKKMAHAFMQAPSYLNIHEALRYAQVIGLGGDDYLAWYINGSYLGRNNFVNERFWSEVIEFFVKAGMFDMEKVEEIVDYIREQYTQNNGYSMKGRTINSVLRQTQEWHQTLNRRLNRGGNYVWKTCGIDGFIWEEGTGVKNKFYEIQELLSTNELKTEGAKQKHCVASYETRCYKGQCAIFTLKSEEFGMIETLITLEVDLNSKTIVQARGKYNRAMQPKEKHLVMLWAQNENLKVSKWV